MSDTDETQTDEGSTDGATVEDALATTPHKVRGELSDAPGIGVLGRATAGSAATRGVKGVTDSDDADAAGVLGVAANSNGFGYGVKGTAASLGGYGLYTPDDAGVDGNLHLDGDLYTETRHEVYVDDSRCVQVFPEGSGNAGAVKFGNNSNDTHGTWGSVVGGGGFDDGSTVEPNEVKRDYGVVGGGRDNVVDGSEATIAGGTGNRATAQKAAIGGGQDNEASTDAVVGGGQSNVAGYYSAVLGGYTNEATADSATVGGGELNKVHDNYGVVAGGQENEAGDDADGDTTLNTHAAVGGGYRNLAKGKYSTIAGGSQNEITSGGEWGMIPGGIDNVVSGQNAFAAGWNAQAKNNGAFVWADNDSANFASDTEYAGTGVTGADTFNVRSYGGVRFVTSDTNGTYISAGGAGWSNTSSRAVKTEIEPVDPEDALSGVESMAVSTWEYVDEDGEGAGVRHVGPMAEDFHDTLPFDVGDSDEHINSVNADGVALAAIQGLSERLADTRSALDDARATIDRRDERIDAVERENEGLRERLDGLEARIDAVEPGPSPAPADD